MTETTLPSIVITRFFDAPRDLVFAAMNEPEHVKHWWGPHHFTVPHVEADLRVGGGFRLCMRGPDGSEFWVPGEYREYDPPKRSVVTSGVEGPDGKLLFETLSIVTFEEVDGKTKVTLEASVTALHDPNMAPAIAGMEEGWSQSFERLNTYLTTI
jgi:uncharacterized protein YndB with AHSA1/START domain